MRICFCDDTAHLIWRHYDNRIVGQPVFGHTPNAGPLVPRALPSNHLPAQSSPKQFGVDLTLLGTRGHQTWGLPDDEPLHLLVDRSKRNRTNHRVITHSSCGNVPNKAFLELRTGVFVTSPEYHFIRQAEHLDLISLIMLGFELTGCYSIRPDLEEGLFQRPPLCSKESIAAAIRSAKGSRGVSIAESALPLIQGGSASPRETGLVMMLCLPVRMGGFGLPAPVLNKRIDLGESAKPYWGSRNAFDLVWEKEHLIVEYDGKCHTEHDLRARDTLRRDASILSGYSTFVITKDRLETVDDVRAIAKAIARKVGIQLRTRSKDFDQKNRELWRRVIQSRFV